MEVREAEIPVTRKEFMSQEIPMFSGRWKREGIELSPRHSRRKVELGTPLCWDFLTFRTVEEKKKKDFCVKLLNLWYFVIATKRILTIYQ